MRSSTAELNSASTEPGAPTDTTAPGAAKKRIRKNPDRRRAEILATATEIALAEGLECITMRRIGEELGVRPGLISHYFPVAEELVAEAFGTAASAEIEELIPAARPEGSPLTHLAEFLSRTAEPRFTDMSRLWLNARHLSRFRPILATRVLHQETRWHARLSELLREGVEAQQFHTANPDAAAIRILIVLDGIGAYANDNPDDMSAAAARLPFNLAATVANLPIDLAARELEVPNETLHQLIETMKDTTRDHNPHTT